MRHRRCQALALHGLEQRAESLRYRYIAHLRAAGFQIAPGAQDQPDARAVEQRDCRTVDRNVGHIAELQRMERLVDARRFGDDPLSAEHEPRPAPAPLQPQCGGRGDLDMRREVFHRVTAKGEAAR